jgi:hypothetical protein
MHFISQVCHNYVIVSHPRQLKSTLRSIIIFDRFEC